MHFLNKLHAQAAVCMHKPMASFYRRAMDFDFVSRKNKFCSTQGEGEDGENIFLLKLVA
jgi:hypothetical protein